MQASSSTHLRLVERLTIYILIELFLKNKGCKLQIITTFEMIPFRLRDYLSKFTTVYDTKIPDSPSDHSTDIILTINNRWIEAELQAHRIKTAILTALADAEMVSIINSTVDQSKSVYDIIMETKMPHTTAYRKIKWLVDQELLVIDRISISDEGKKYSLFRSVFRSIVVKYENIKIIIEAEQNIDPVNRLTERFFSLWVDK